MMNDGISDKASEAPPPAPYLSDESQFAEQVARIGEEEPVPHPEPTSRRSLVILVAAAIGVVLIGSFGMKMLARHQLDGAEENDVSAAATPTEVIEHAKPQTPAQATKEFRWSVKLSLGSCDNAWSRLMAATRSPSRESQINEVEAIGRNTRRACLHSWRLLGDLSTPGILTGQEKLAADQALEYCSMAASTRGAFAGSFAATYVATALSGGLLDQNDRAVADEKVAQVDEELEKCSVSLDRLSFAQGTRPDPIPTVQHPTNARRQPTVTADAHLPIIDTPAGHHPT